MCNKLDFVGEFAAEVGHNCRGKRAKGEHFGPYAFQVNLPGRKKSTWAGGKVPQMIREMAQGSLLQPGGGGAVSRGMRPAGRGGPAAPDAGGACGEKAPQTPPENFLPQAKKPGGAQRGPPQRGDPGGVGGRPGRRRFWGGGGARRGQTGRDFLKLHPPGKEKPQAPSASAAKSQGRPFEPAHAEGGGGCGRAARL